MDHLSYCKYTYHYSKITDMCAIKIDKITDYSYKSFKQYTGPSSLFGRANIFFASNGQGKSSFALGIEDEYLKNHERGNYRIYNKDFVEDHLMLEGGSGIKGVVANFSKENVGIEKSIKTLTKGREDLKEEADRLRDDNAKLAAATERAIADIFKRRKGKANIQQKSHRDGLHEKVVALWIKEYEYALKRFPEENYNEVDGEKDFNENLNIINAITVPFVTGLMDHDIEQSAIIIGKTYDNISIPSGNVVDWLEVGLGIHQGKDTCEFCLGALDAVEIRGRVNSYLRDEKNIDRKKLEILAGQVAQLVEHIQATKKSRDTLIAALGNSEKVINALDKLDGQTGTLKAYLSAAQDKINDVDSTFEVDVPAVKRAVATCETSFETIREEKTNQRTLFEEKINRLEVLVKGAIGYEVKNSLLITNNCKQYKDNNDAIRDLESKIKEKDTEIQSLRNSKLAIADFSEYVNKVLNDIGASFMLDPLNEHSYSIKHSINGDNLSLEDISEGEKNLLSLIYFYYEMLSDDERNLKDNIEVVIVDDPTSSMDDENRFYILELIKSIVGNRNIQSFVFTHSWRDYCDLCYGKDKKQGVKMFEIRKTQGISTVEASNSIMTPYRKLFKEVYDFSQKQPGDIQPDEALHMPNTMRRVLEEYLRFTIGIDFATQARYNEIARVLLNQEVANISSSNETKINTLLSVCNILSHGTPQGRSTNEIHASARFLMDKLKTANKYHFDKMKE